MKAEPATSNVNLCLTVQQHAGHEARIIRQKIARKESEIIALRAEYEKIVRHAAIEGVSLDDPAPKLPDVADGALPRDAHADR